MSIIHEALKKAERVRELRPTGLPLSRRVRTARRSWRPGATRGLLIGLAMVGAGSFWLWFYAPKEGLSVNTPELAMPSLPAMALDRSTRRPLPLPSVHRPPDQASPVGAPSATVAGVPHLPIPALPTVEMQVTAQAAFERAREAEGRAQWEEATQHYRQALTLDPALVEARNNLGTLYVRQHQLPAAIDEFRAAVRLAPNHAMVRNNLGSAYILSGQETLAIQEFLTALHIDGTYVSPLYNLASLYARRGDVSQTIAFLTRALALEPAVLSWLQEDADFDGVRTAPDIERLYTQVQARP
jgi:tetratricopeptide (TPR) repeat protein